MSSVFQWLDCCVVHLSFKMTRLEIKAAWCEEGKSNCDFHDNNVKI